MKERGPHLSLCSFARYASYSNSFSKQALSITKHRGQPGRVEFWLVVLEVLR
ncbi:hypothetical protein BDV98DRAFT_564951 [Pterulicium gracile]|uniref:Uncharacterized protein n=1 Tax=Pterulicium gracile TaxID=1884261 RepID=A0A5C3QNC8_9AGAR|nr:hypothetical protein BDV98DRAFT_564951 [Pterula gracilis]